MKAAASGTQPLMQVWMMENTGTKVGGELERRLPVYELVELRSSWVGVNFWSCLEPLGRGGASHLGVCRAPPSFQHDHCGNDSEKMTRRNLRYRLASHSGATLLQ
jgi:hypothetical protein